MRKLLAKRPQLLKLRVESGLRPRIDFLRDRAGVAAERVGRVVLLAPQLLDLDVEETLAPRVEYLVGLGLTIENVGKAIGRDPTLLTHREESMQSRVDYLQVNLGFRFESFTSATTNIFHPPLYSVSVVAFIYSVFWLTLSIHVYVSLTLVRRKKGWESLGCCAWLAPTRTCSATPSTRSSPASSFSSP